MARRQRTSRGISQGLTPSGRRGGGRDSWAGGGVGVREAIWLFLDQRYMLVISCTSLFTARTCCEDGWSRVMAIGWRSEVRVWLYGKVAKDCRQEAGGLWASIDRRRWLIKHGGKIFREKKGWGWSRYLRLRVNVCYIRGFMREGEGVGESMEYGVWRFIGKDVCQRRWRVELHQRWCATPGVA